MKTYTISIFPILLLAFVLSSFSSKSDYKFSNDESQNKIEIENTKLQSYYNNEPVKTQKRVKNKVRKIKNINKKNDEPRVEGLGLAGFILGLVGWFIPYLGFLMCLLAIIFGSVSLWKITRNPEKFKGKGFAITSLIMGILGILVTLLIIAAISSIFLL